MCETKHKQRAENRLSIVLGLGFLLLLCSGCRDADYIEKTYQIEESYQEAESMESQEIDGTIEVEEEIASTEEIETTETIKETEKAQEERTLVIYICGAVNRPGVYELPSDARVIHAIEAAGGLRADADLMMVNQARLLADGEQIQILTKDEAAQMKDGKQLADSFGEDAEASVSMENSSKVNLNLAAAAELMTLPGIGKAKAEAIIRYRKEHGSFTSITDIMKISGIKESVFSKIKDLITV